MDETTMRKKVVWSTASESWLYWGYDKLVHIIFISMKHPRILAQSNSNEILISLYIDIWVFFTGLIDITDVWEFRTMLKKQSEARQYVLKILKICYVQWEQICGWQMQKQILWGAAEGAGVV